MAAITICNDFGAQKNNVSHCFHCFPIYLPWSDEIGCHDIDLQKVICFVSKILSDLLSLNLVWSYINLIYLSFLFFIFDLKFCYKWETIIAFIVLDDPVCILSNWWWTYAENEKESMYFYYHIFLLIIIRDYKKSTYTFNHIINKENANKLWLLLHLPKQKI